MIVSNILAILTASTFLIYILTSKSIYMLRRQYLIFILFFFPLIDLTIVPAKFGGFTVFDFITVVTFFLLLFLNKINYRSAPNIWICNSIFAFMFLLLIGSLASESVQNSLLEIIKIYGIITFSILLYNECLHDQFFFIKIIKYLKIACIISMLFLCCQVIFGLQVTLYNLAPNASQLDAMVRYPSMFIDPQQFAQFLAMSSFLFLIRIPDRNVGYVNIGIFLLVLTAILITGVRAALLGTCAGVIMVFFFGHKRLRYLGILFVIFMTIVYNFFGENFALFNRNISSKDMAGIRFSYWDKALTIFDQSPFLGIGVGNYQKFVSVHDRSQVWDYFGVIEYVTHPESGFLKLLVEYGIFAFTIGILFILIPIYRSLKILILSSGENSTLLYLTASVVSWLVAFSTVYSFADVRIFLMVIFILSIIVSINRDYKLHRNFSKRHFNT